MNAQIEDIKLLILIFQHFYFLKNNNAFIHSLIETVPSLKMKNEGWKVGAESISFHDSVKDELL